MPQPTLWNIILQLVDLIANGFAIATGLVAIFVWRRLKGDDQKRVVKLEGYLKEARASGGNYQHSALHLSGRLGMTEEQIFQAAGASTHIEKVLKQGDHGFADRILFQYTTGDGEKDLELEGATTARRGRQGAAMR